MEKYTDMCEKIEICVFSGDELTEEMKAHVNECDHCRSFLEQNEKLCEDLKNLNVTGIEEGKIADGVMAKINSLRTSGSKRFNFTHHMGTAAALVIICAVALYVKNVQPTDVDKPIEISESTIENENVNETKILTGTSFLAVNDDETSDAESGVEALEEEFVEDSEPKMLKLTRAASPEVAQESVNGVNTTAESDGLQNTAYDLYNDVNEEAKSPEKSTSAKEETPMLMSAPVATEIATEEVEEYTGEVFAEPVEQEAMNDIVTDSAAEAPMLMFSPSSGGGGGGGSSRGDGENDDVAFDDKYNDSYLVFEGLEFLQGEQNIEINVAIANQRLAQLYGDEFCCISSLCLINNGWNGNQFFFEHAPTMTYSFLVSLEGTSKTLTGK
jgi:hypothetical protein